MQLTFCKEKWQQPRYPWLLLLFMTLHCVQKVQNLLRVGGVEGWQGIDVTCVAKSREMILFIIDLLLGCCYILRYSTTILRRLKNSCLLRDSLRARCDAMYPRRMGIFWTLKLSNPTINESISNLNADEPTRTNTMILFSISWYGTYGLRYHSQQPSNKR